MRQNATEAYTQFLITPGHCLDQTEQTIIMLLSIFRGGFNREAAQQVTRTSLPILAGLVNKSFLSHNPDTGRFEIHEVLRHYTQEKLEKTPEDMIKAQKIAFKIFC